MEKSKTEFTHIPVLLDEVLDFLITTPNGVYVDATFGLGGHTKAFSSRLSKDATLIGIDQDNSVLQANSTLKLPQIFFPVHNNFRNIKSILSKLSINGIDAILMDLGLNSFSLDDPNRGFAFDKSGPLDMRFNQENPISAFNIINEYSEHELSFIFRKYSDAKYHRKIANAIVTARLNEPVSTTDALKLIIASVVPSFQVVKSYAKVFQAIRIEVNDEVGALEQVLVNIIDVLNPGGRIGVISYHSLEDRIIKREK